MQWKQLDSAADGRRTYAIIFQTGDEAIAGLKSFAEEQRLSASAFTAIGAFRHCTIAYFDWKSKDYQRIPIEEQVEVLTLIGDVSLDPQNKPKVHAHTVLGRSDGTTRGGHLMEAHVRPTLEVILTESPAQLQRRHDPDSGLALIRL